MATDPELQRIDAIYDALDRQAPEEAWTLAEEGLADAADDPVLRYLAGQALFAMDRAVEAVPQFKRACELDPDDPEFRCFLAWALFRACRFGEAREELDRVEDDGRLPEPPFLEGLILERDGKLEEADAAFAQAASRDPEGYPAPLRLSDAEFGARLEAARSGLEARFRDELRQVTVMVEPVPAEALLTEQLPPLDPEQLLGLFAGIPRGEESNFSPGGELPPRIYLFQRNLERYALEADELVEQIRITLYHELGHYLGMTEEELERLGYG